MESVISSIVIRKLRPIILCAFLVLLTMLEGSWLEAKEVEEYFIFQLNDKKGVRNSKDKILIPAEYEDLGWSIGEFHPLNETLGFKENGLWGLLSLKKQKNNPRKISEFISL